MRPFYRPLATTYYFNAFALATTSTVVFGASFITSSIYILYAPKPILGTIDRGGFWV